MLPHRNTERLSYGRRAAGTAMEFYFFWIIFVLPGSVRRENSEKLEFDDPLNEHGCFLRSQELQNEVEIVPKRAEERKKSRERREKKKKYADECLGSARERSRARRRPPRVPRGGRKSADWIRPDRANLLFPRF